MYHPPHTLLSSFCRLSFFPGFSPKSLTSSCLSLGRPFRCCGKACLRQNEFTGLVYGEKSHGTIYRRNIRVCDLRGDILRI